MVKADPYAYTVFLGDVTDDDRPSTRRRRTDMYSDRPEALSQEETQHMDYLDRRVVPEFKKFIAPNRCLGMLDGDHYRRYSSGLTSVQYLCGKLRLPYLGGGTARLKLIFGAGSSSHMFRMHVQHGLGGNGRPGNAVNSLDSFATSWEGVNCFVRGHNHRSFIYPVSRYYENKAEEISQKDIWLINTPSFRTGLLDGSTDYAEARGYGATSHKFPVLHILTTRYKENNSNIGFDVSGELI